MLSLGRKSGQYVVIGGNIVVKVEGTQNGLKLLVEAPENVNVVRSEVWERSNPVPACILEEAKRTKKTAAVR